MKLKGDIFDEKLYIMGLVLMCRMVVGKQTVALALNSEYHCSDAFDCVNLKSSIRIFHPTKLRLVIENAQVRSNIGARSSILQRGRGPKLTGQYYGCSRDVCA